MRDPGALVDLHAHFLTEDYVDAARAAGVHHPDGVPRWPQWRESDHLGVMDAAGIGVAVLSISSPGTHFGDDAAARRLTHAVNAAAAAVAARRPDRFGWFASLPMPDAAGALQEIERAADEGADGFVLLTEALGRRLTDPVYEDVLAALDERAAVVLLHPTSGLGPPVPAALPPAAVEFPLATTRAVLEYAAAGGLERHPHVRFVVPHAGGAVPSLAARAALFLRRTDGRPQLLDALRSLWWDTAGAPLPFQLPALAAAFGQDRIVFGSDYCWTPAGEVPELTAALAGVPAPSGSTTWLQLCTVNGAVLLPPDLTMPSGIPTKKESR